MSPTIPVQAREGDVVIVFARAEVEAAVKLDKSKEGGLDVLSDDAWRALDRFWAKLNAARNQPKPEGVEAIDQGTSP